MNYYLLNDLAGVYQKTDQSISTKNNTRCIGFENLK